MRLMLVSAGIYVSVGVCNGYRHCASRPQLGADSTCFGCCRLVSGVIPLAFAVGNYTKLLGAMYRRRVMCGKRGGTLAWVYHYSVYVVDGIYGNNCSDNDILEGSAAK